MATKTKSPPKPLKKKVPAPGRKLSKQEARDFVFKKHGEALDLLGEALNPKNDDIEFLTFEDVCAIHDRGLAEFGFGGPGFLDEHSVRSAAAQPQAGMNGVYFYEFPAGMAAAYLYYLTNQQGFVNGNKRAAVGSALEFLARNGYRVETTNLELYEMTIELAGEDVKKESAIAIKEIQEWMEARLRPMD